MKIGAAFSDHIKTEKIRKRSHSEDYVFPMRLFSLILLLIVLPAVLLLKLTNLQLINGSYYRSLSDSNRTRTNIIHAPRGVIFDRNGIPLVYNIPGFREVQGEKATLITRAKAMDLLAKGNDKLEIDSLREYPLKDAGAHVLGYVGQISKEDLSFPEFSNYHATDVIGKAGIEEEYERLLRGVDGKELVEVDAVGKKIRTLGQTDPIPGKDITITLDSKLQQAAYDALPSDKKAAVIAATPQGEILALVSRPSFDPNLFTMDKTYTATNSAYATVTDILTDSANQPLLNRAIGGVYPPGSTFKLVTAAAGLENHIIDSSYTVEDTGILRLGEFSFANWYYLEYGKTDGNVNVVKAISRSNDIFFYKLAEKVSVDTLSATGAKFGLGHTLGIDLLGEQSGLLPTKAWKQKTIGEQWYLGDTYHYGIGQGYVLTTPLQVNAWTQAIANGGKFYRPRVIKNSINDPLKTNIMTSSTINIIRQGMIGACNPGGVAYPLYNFKVKNKNLKVDGENFSAVPIGTASAGLKNPEEYRQVSVACKTGTAQVGDEDTKPHAWITLFAPAYNPQIVVTVLVESGGQGSEVAAPVAKKMLEEWFTE